MRFAVVGRHKFTESQLKLLKKIGLVEEVARFQQVQDVGKVVEEAKELNAEAIVIQALPMHLLAQLLAAAGRAGVSVYSFRIEAVATIPLDQPCPAEADIEIVDARTGNKRCSRTMALQQLKRIVVEAEDVATI